jgi:GNAT superfamily N-acetyltransferase
MIEYMPATTPEHLAQIRDLFTEYVDSLGFQLDFQDYQKEFDELPGEYTPPHGRLILALEGHTAVGCIALRKLDEKTCEMKRMYVRPEYRGKGIGRRLAEILIDEARGIGYMIMKLDTIATMKAAIALYRSMGFCDTCPYRYNPVEGATFMELRLK